MLNVIGGFNAYTETGSDQTTCSVRTYLNNYGTAPINSETGCLNGSTSSGTACSTTSCPPGYLFDSPTNSCILPAGVADPSKNRSCPSCGENSGGWVQTHLESVGDPINVANGNQYEIQTDYIGLGPYPLRLERIYNSATGLQGIANLTAWGTQQRDYYERSIVYSSNGTSLRTAALERADGKVYNFSQAIGTATPPLTTTTWTPDADVNGTLTQTGTDANGNPTWMYVNEQNETENYDGAGRLLTITNLKGLTQALTYSDGTSGANGGFVLDAAGNPTATVLPAGLLIRVTDPAGRTLQYGYDASSRVVKMTDPAARAYLYTYDISNNLASVTYPDGKTRTYLYAYTTGETANISITPNLGVDYVHSLTGIIDENGTRYSTWTYDAAGRASSNEMGATGSGINKFTLSYTTPDSSGNSTTSVTDARGVARTYGFATQLGVVKLTGITGQPCDGCAQSFGFDPNGSVASYSDFNGNTTCYLYDTTRNLETIRLEGLAPVSGTTTPVACPANLSTYTPAAGTAERKVSTQWSTSLRLPTVVAEPLRITTYNYNANGTLLSKTIQPTTDTTGGAGFSATVTGTPRTWTYTYNNLGEVHTVDGPRTDVNDITTYDYDAQGNLTTVTNALNQITTLGNYDANGRVRTITDPNGLATTLTYDARGRLTILDRGGEVTNYTYDNAGNLTNVSLPTGASYTYTYDQAHRLTRITDLDNNYIQYTLDNAGNRTKTEVKNSAGTVQQTHSRVFDSLNHLVQDIDAVNTNAITYYTYDADGNLQTVKDPLNHTTTDYYDALNRLNQVNNPDSGIVKYAYNGLDQLTQVTDPRNLITSYTRDGLNDLTQRQSSDTGATSLTYDAAGNVLTRTDAKGQVATYTYDALNRVTGVTYTGGSASAVAVTYQYDQGANGIGHLTNITDPTGTNTFTYDRHGRLLTQTEQTQGVQYTTSYGYDASGRLAAIGYPSGKTISYAFDTQGRISQISSITSSGTTILASTITYEPFGGVHSFKYGDGVTAPVQTYTRNRDQDGRIGNYTLNGGSRTLSIAYDAASQIQTINDTANPANPANFGYDPMSRLNSYTQGSISQSYGYDVDGNRTTQTLGATTTTYAFGYSIIPSNQLTGITVGTNPQQAISHDANGATTADTSRQYSYDLRGRLIQAQTAQGAVNYEINAMGLRTRKHDTWSGGSDTEYLYDTAGRLIAEGATGTTTISREYIWLGDIPVAVLQ